MAIFNKQQLDLAFSKGLINQDVYNKGLEAINSSMPEQPVLQSQPAQQSTVPRNTISGQYDQYIQPVVDFVGDKVNQIGQAIRVPQPGEAGYTPITTTQQDIENAKKPKIQIPSIQPQEQVKENFSSAESTFQNKQKEKFQNDLIKQQQEQDKKLIESYQKGQQVAATQVGYAKQIEGERNKAQRDLETANLEFDTKSKEINDKIQKIAQEPIKDFWADKSTGSKIMAGLAIALSGIGNAMAGKVGENQAFDSIMKQMDQDIALQIKDKAARTDAFKLALDSLKDVNLAGMKIKEQQLANINAKFQNYATQRGLNLEENKFNFMVDSERRKLEAEQKKIALQNSLFSGDENESRQTQILNSLDEKTRERVVKLPKDINSQTGLSLAFSEDNKKKADDSIITYNKLSKILNDLKSISNNKNELTKYFGGTPGDLAILKSNLKGLIAKQITGGGNISEFEQKLLDKVVPDPQSTFSLDSIENAKIDQFIKNNKTTLKSELNQYLTSPVNFKEDYFSNRKER